MRWSEADVKEEGTSSVFSAALLWYFYSFLLLGFGLWREAEVRGGAAVQIYTGYTAGNKSRINRSLTQNDVMYSRHLFMFMSVHFFNLSWDHLYLYFLKLCEGVTQRENSDVHWKCDSPSSRSPSLCQSPSALCTLSCRMKQNRNYSSVKPSNTSDSDSDSVMTRTCKWAPRCVAVCPSSRLRCRIAAAAAGHSRRWWTCSWTEEAPPPGSYPAPPPERTHEPTFKLVN